jgi:uncharacterized protein YndB with AHSA1/START domain
MESVFRALADESRRKLLDLLFLRDGRSLGELCEHLPSMTRFGVMKHLRILEEAGLVVTRKHGRAKAHYLNAVPIQMVYDRWVSKYARGWARSLTELKYDLEEKMMTENAATKTETAERPTMVHEVYIRATPEKLWQAITDGDLTEKYYYGTRIECDWMPGAEYAYKAPDGSAMLSGKIKEIEPLKRLVKTFIPRWNASGDMTGQEGSVSEVVYEIEQKGEACKLTLTHYDLAQGDPMTEGIKRGWSEILSGLKTLLETGKPLTIN